METEIGKEIIDIDDVSITNDGSKIEVKSSEKSIIIKCRNEEIEIMNKEGYSNFGDLFINGVKIEDKFSKLVKLNDLMQKLKSTEIFYVNEIPKTNGDLKVDYCFPNYKTEYDSEENDDGTVSSISFPFYYVGKIDGTTYFSNENGNAYDNIHTTSYGSEYIYVNGEYAYVVNTSYVRNNKNNKLRLAKNSIGNTRFEPPLPGYKYKLVFSNFENTEGVRFIVDGGVYTSEIFNGSYETIVEINNYIEIYINSRTYLREGNQASLYETEGIVMCTMALVI